MGWAEYYHEFRKRRKLTRYLRSGQMPWSRGYQEHKEQEICRVLETQAFTPETLPDGYGFRLDERIVEYPWLFSRLPVGGGKLLDAGSVLNFEFILNQPSLQSKDLHICTLAPEDRAYWQRGVSYLFGDLRDLPYREDCFDWIVSISTLEHVGLDNTVVYTSDPGLKESRPRDYLKAVTEFRRVLKPGGRCFLTVPFGQAAVHEWLQVFDSVAIQKMITTFAPAEHSAWYFRYRADGWHASSAGEASDATWFNIHAGQGYDADFAASARAVCCLDLSK
jgi:SAM-dependent methyltransferase